MKDSIAVPTFRYLRFDVELNMALVRFLDFGMAVLKLPNFFLSSPTPIIRNTAFPSLPIIDPRPAVRILAWQVALIMETRGMREERHP